jgi:SAM-dependent methyltransferase
MTDTFTVAADRGLKTKHRAMWASGDYADVASVFTLGLGRILVEAAGVSAGDRVLDVAAGTGAVAVPAAEAGGHVTASDLTPELFEAGRTYAAEHGVHIDWQEADAETLPYTDNAFDVVLSCLGVMFAPHHQAAADELVRVCRPGGAIGLLSWTPEGFLGQLLRTMKPYVPAPPTGAQPPTLWGAEDHVRELLGDRVTDIRARTGLLRVERFTDGAGFRDYFKHKYGPCIAAYRNVADDPERTAALDRDLADVARRHDLGEGAMEWEYLLMTARVAK